MLQCVNKQIVVLLWHPVFKCAGQAYFLFLEQGISFRVNSRMGYKKLAHF